MILPSCRLKFKWVCYIFLTFILSSQQPIFLNKSNRQSNNILYPNNKYSLQKIIAQYFLQYFIHSMTSKKYSQPQINSILKQSRSEIYLNKRNYDKPLTQSRQLEGSAVRYSIKHHDWMNYSLKLQKQLQHLKLQLQEVQHSILQKNLQLERLNRQIEVLKQEKDKKLLSVDHQQKQILMQQLANSNKKIAEIVTQNQWLKNQLNNKKQEKEPKTNYKMQEQMRSVRYSYELYQKKVEKLLEDVSKYEKRIQQLTKQNMEQSKTSQKQTSNLRKFKQDVGMQIDILQSSFLAYLSMDQETLVI